MKKRYTFFSLLSLLSLMIILLMPGCYTQLSTTRDEYDDEEIDAVTETEGEEAPQEEYTENYEYEDSYRPRVGFSYYYPATYWPSSAFIMAYSDPWFYDYNWWAYDRSFYTSPYSWYYSSWYPSYYYSPYYYGYYYNNGGSSVYGSKRNDGTMVGADNSRRVRDSQYEVGGSARTNFDMPTGLSRTTSNVSGGRNATKTGTSTRRDAANTVDTRRENRSSEKAFDRTVQAPQQERKVRTDNTKKETRSQPRRVDQSKPQSPSQPRRAEPRRSEPSKPQSPSYNPPPRENRTPSYTPPPAPRSNPPSSSGSGSRSGSSGGSSSGGSGGSRDRRP